LVLAVLNGHVWRVAVNKGTTVVQRKSSESSVTIPDRETTKTLVKRVDDALEGKTTYKMNKVRWNAARTVFTESRFSTPT
jgi:hypothetical protein